VLFRLVDLIGPGVQFAEAKVAVGDEWAADDPVMTPGRQQLLRTSNLFDVVRFGTPRRGWMGLLRNVQGKPETSLFLWLVFFLKFRKLRAATLVECFAFFFGMLKALKFFYIIQSQHKSVALFAHRGSIFLQLRTH
jgi:hypothetical protein